MSDIVSKLRAYASPDGLWTAALLPEDVLKAADEIERRHGIGGELMIARRERDALLQKLQDLGRYLNSQSRERGASDYEQAMGDAANMLWDIIGDP